MPTKKAEKRTEFDDVFFTAHLDDAYANTIVECFDAGPGGHQATVRALTVDGRWLIGDDWAWHSDEGILVIPDVCVEVRVRDVTGLDDAEWIVPVTFPAPDDGQVVVGRVDDNGDVVVQEVVGKRTHVGKLLGRDPRDDEKLQSRSDRKRTPDDVPVVPAEPFVPAGDDAKADDEATPAVTSPTP